MSTRQPEQVLSQLQRWIGSILFTFGLLGDCVIGLLLLTRADDTQLFLLHFPVALLWVSGTNFICKQYMHNEQRISIYRMQIHKWSIVALLLSWCTFPGFGALAYSIALLTSKFLRQAATREPAKVQIATSRHKVFPPLNLDVQPVIDLLHTSDLEVRRAAVAVLSRHVNPGGIQLLRQLLADGQPEIRSDASLALTHLEEKLATALNTSLEQWMTDPINKERALHLADQYYTYACSNLLDEVSQHCYLAKAYDVLQQCISLNSMHADLWLKQARICQRLGETTEALQAVRTSLQLQPHSAEAYLLAMEIAFSLHAWDLLFSFAREASLLPASEVHTTLHWWLRLTLHPEGEMREVAWLTSV